ncbi:MAG: peptidase M42 [Cyanobacteria bacterium SW_9_44_58]|nr:MAG: peptidase M42 [Cyanobacteria bacterium SW_9_44_58]
MPNFDALFNAIAELVLCHSPSGAEQEIDRALLEKFQTLGVETWQDQAGNIIAKIPGQNSDSAIAITAHKDEIGTIVKRIGEDGTLEVRRLGGSFPWVYGEGVMDIIGDRATISRILSFGSRHVSHESPQQAQELEKPLFWEDAWVETKCTATELETAGVRPGTRVVVGKHRKQPFRLNQNYIAGYTLDNKASLAIILDLAQQIKQPPQDIYLIASAKEEVGSIGALYFTQNQRLDGLIALEIIPLAGEYSFQPGEAPVLLSQDKYGLYDEGLNGEIATAAETANVSLQRTIIDGFGSDGSIAMKMGHVSRAACLGFPTDNTHGYEIAHLGAIANCPQILASYASSV